MPRRGLCCSHACLSCMSRACNCQLQPILEPSCTVRSEAPIAVGSGKSSRAMSVAYSIISRGDLPPSSLLAPALLVCRTKLDVAQTPGNDNDSVVFNQWWWHCQYTAGTISALRSIGARGLATPIVSKTPGPVALRGFRGPWDCAGNSAQCRL